MKYLSLLVIIIAYNWSCKEVEIQSPSPALTPTHNYMGNAQMIDSLQKIYGAVNFTDHPFENDLAVALLDEKIATNKMDKTLKNFINYAISQLNKGDNRKGINVFEQIFGFSKELSEMTDYSKPLYEMYAVANLRLGEVTNCVNNHNEDSCLYPIKDKAIHSDKSGSLKAIEVYKRILAKYPDDYQSKWLLNIASMTVGGYPNNIDKKHFIPFNKMQNNTEIQRFKDLAMDVGLAINGLSGASILEDFDNDGDIDALISEWNLKGQLRYFENIEGTYIDQTQQAHLIGLYGGLNMQHADYNNDGHLDVLVLRGAWREFESDGIYPNSLLKNNGDGTFSDVTISSNLYHIGPSQSAVWTDINNDGWIDIYLVHESTPVQGRKRYPNKLYINNGDGTFNDQANIYGLDYLGFFKGVDAADYDNDGDQDLYITNLVGNNIFAHNQLKETGETKFINKSQDNGTLEPKRAFPCWFFDYDNDGWEDLFVSAFDEFKAVGQSEEMAKYLLGNPINCEGPRLYKNMANGKFEDRSQFAKLDIPLHSMGCNYGDINNDGFEDFYLGTGSPDFRTAVPNRLFINNENGGYIDATLDANVGTIQKGHGVSFVDIDRDGDLDIYTVLGGAYTGDFFHNALYINENDKNNWIKIKLIGTTTNKAAIGSKIKLDYINADGVKNTVYKTIGSGSSFGSNELTMHIGLQQATSIENIGVRWANGSITYVDYGGTNPNQLIQITENQSDFISSKIDPKPLKLNHNNHNHH